ncbi:hypothetical protein K435DRAFT_411300 [Dendrothele bispora CBS 962.96]|uniref:Cytochrome b5 heme-binding domain-containing protein n=1 Tax=Dendrothele bispora (strain CBS 962.96) TaxID=1314807 RepID=A0A4S8L7N4_DENBC|nr:hypothetical protein K435DRAFT_411300 [Dendrothele bispora CBS 962.96]
MAAYIRSWLPSSLTSTTVTSTESTNSTDAGPEVNIVQHEEEDDNGSDTEKEDNDIPPAFPAISSAQRLSSNTASPELKSNAKGIPKFLTDAQLMAPPPIPGPRIPGVSVSSASSLAVPASASSSLAVPPTTTKPPTQLGVQKSKKREKVALAPGHSPLDWAALKSSGQDLRGVDALMRITPSVLKQHNKRDDAWSAFNGKVYNITPYLPFHPGGEKELMRVAGRDGTKLFGMWFS